MEPVSKRIRQYVTAIVGASIAAAVAVLVVVGFGSYDDVTASAFFGALVLLSLLLRYEGSRSGATGTISFLPALAGVVVAPVFATSLIIGVAAMVSELAAKRPLVRVVFNVFQLQLAAALAVLAVHTVVLIELPTALEYAASLVVAAVLFHTANTATVAGVIAIESRRSVSEVWLAGALRTLVYDVLALPVVFLLAWSYTEKGIATVLLFVLPIFGIRQLYKQNWELEHTNEELLQVMVKAIEARDQYTSGHSVRVSRYAVQIARIVKLDAKSTEQLRVAALLHDVGKIHEEFAPILSKSSRLTEEEMRLMETHPIRSAQLVSNVKRLGSILSALRSHHERWDGCGYPDGLSSIQIPLLARYIAVADTVDAMTSSRPYRSALSIDDVREELRRGSGKQFDPAIIAPLIATPGWRHFLSVFSPPIDNTDERADNLDRSQDAVASVR